MSGTSFEIKPKKHLFDIDLKEIWDYRDLVFMFVKRDVVTSYKQTILGPIWFFIQPIFTTLIYIVVFGNIAKLSTDGVPMILFYLAGIILWNYFSESFNSTSRTFVENANLFGKVYFPRLILPISKIISGLIKFFIQFVLFLGVYVYFFFFKDTSTIEPNLTLLLLPFYLFLMAVMGLGFGIIFSSLTTKYRDLNFLLTFGVQLLMYATPVIYPLSSLSADSLMRKFLIINPLTSILEAMKFGFLGKGYFSVPLIAYTTLFSLIFLLVGVLIFNKTERTFIDSV
ncbi:MAG: ABC transporter permease [Breznakibacter sp.]